MANSRVLLPTANGGAWRIVLLAAVACWHTACTLSLHHCCNFCPVQSTEVGASVKLPSLNVLLCGTCRVRQTTAWLATGEERPPGIRPLRGHRQPASGGSGAGGSHPGGGHRHPHRTGGGAVELSVTALVMPGTLLVHSWRQQGWALLCCAGVRRGTRESGCSVQATV